MANKTLVSFNIKNAKYALKTANGYESPVAFGYSDSITLDADYAEKIIYGDGKKILIIPNDKGMTGSLVLLNEDQDYEIAMKRKMKTANGTAVIKQLSSIEHAIYFEIDYIEDDGEVKTAKVIIYGVTSGRPSQAYNQTTDDINNNNTSYPLTIKGIPMMDSAGTNPYKDAKGNIVYAWQEISTPDHTGYESFGKTITAPKAISATPLSI